MALDDLRRLEEVGAFDPTLPFGALAALHVPFDELAGPPARVEARMISALQRGGRVGLIGASGTGKSSVISAVLQSNRELFAPILVPASSQSERMMAEPVEVAGHLITTITRAARQVGYLGAGEEQEALRRTAPTRRIGRSRQATLTAGVPWLQGKLATDVGDQVADVPVGLDERQEVLDQVLAAVAGQGLIPVLVFDDTDRWIDGVGFEHPTRTVDGFFRRVLRWVSELDCALVVAVHRGYLAPSGARAHLLEALDTPVDLPPLPDLDALARIVRRRITVAFEDSDAATPALHTVMSLEALATAFEDYRRSGLRRAIGHIHLALLDACAIGTETITRPHLASAISAR